MDGHNQTNPTAVFAAAPARVYSSSSWSAEVISEEPFGPANSSTLDDDAEALLRKARVNTGSSGMNVGDPMG